MTTGQKYVGKADNANTNEQTAIKGVSGSIQPDQRQPQRYIVRIPEDVVNASPELIEAINLGTQFPGVMTADFFVQAINTAYALGRASIVLQAEKGGKNNG